MRDFLNLIFRPVIALWFFLFCPVGVLADEAADKPMQGINLLSRNLVKTDAKATPEVVKRVEVNLIDHIKNGLRERNVAVALMDSEDELNKSIAQNGYYVVILKLNGVDQGFRGPFGRITTVRAAFTLQTPDRIEIASQSYDETSHRQWQNCTKKIGEQIAQDIVSSLMDHNSKIISKEKPVAQPLQGEAGDSIDARLERLEQLRSKGLITPEEYKQKRKDILKEL